MTVFLLVAQIHAADAGCYPLGKQGSGESRGGFDTTGATFVFGSLSYGPVLPPAGFAGLAMRGLRIDVCLL
jgi:hypothetical protein